MPTIELSYFQLALAGLLVIVLAMVCIHQALGLSRSLLFSAVRCVVQLACIGAVLKFIFDSPNVFLIFAMITVMIVVAGYEIQSRQKRRLAGFWAYAIGTGSLMMSSVLVAFFTLAVILQLGGKDNVPTPWYNPQYAIPLMGMILGNTMTGIALGIDRLTLSLSDNRGVIEQRLLLGDTPAQCVADYRREAIRAAMIPTINTMAVTGIVSLPGMMTGQILAGNSPVMATHYQILIMFLIAAGSGFGSILATKFAAARLFDSRMRLRLDRLKKQ